MFVGDLGREVTEAMLHNAFGRFGSLSKVRVIRDKHTDKSKGFAFVGFKDPHDFVRALREMNGKTSISSHLPTLIFVLGKYVGSRPVKLKRSNWKDRNIDAGEAAVIKQREEKRKKNPLPK